MDLGSFKSFCRQFTIGRVIKSRMRVVASRYYADARVMQSRGRGFPGLIRALPGITYVICTYIMYA